MLTIGPPVPPGRNPFVGKGLAVTLAMLLEPGRRWSITELARRAEASTALASRVIRQLVRSDLVVGSIHQGRRSEVVATEALLWQTALHWPRPVAWVLGGRLPDDRPLGGGPALHRFGTQVEARPRIYVRSAEDIAGLLARHGGALVSEPVADWEIAVVDFPLQAGNVAEIIAALELGSTPRGREVLEGSDFVARWQAEGTSE